MLTRNSKMLKSVSSVTAMLLMLTCATIRAETCTKERTQLGLCQQLVKDLDDENLLLKQRMTTIARQRDDAEAALVKATEPRLVPEWSWMLIGAALGVGTYAVIRK